MASKERARIHFRLNAVEHSGAGEVYGYLLQNALWDERQGKAMIAQAASDYWLAYARQVSNPELAKSTALACIERLEYHVAKLRQDFELPTPSSVSDTQAVLLTEIIKEVKLITAELPSAIVRSLADGQTASRSLETALPMGTLLVQESAQSGLQEGQIILATGNETQQEVSQNDRAKTD